MEQILVSKDLLRQLLETLRYVENATYAEELSGGYRLLEDYDRGRVVQMASSVNAALVNQHAKPLQSTSAGVTNEQLLAGARVLSPLLFRHGLESQPRDGEKTRQRMADEVNLVRRILAAALQQRQP